MKIHNSIFDDLKNITQIMHVTKVESVELASYQLKDVAHDWYWKKGRGKNAAPINWGVFEIAFLDRLFPYEMRKV